MQQGKEASYQGNYGFSRAVTESFKTKKALDDASKLAHEKKKYFIVSYLKAASSVGLSVEGVDAGEELEAPVGTWLMDELPETILVDVMVTVIGGNWWLLLVLLLEEVNG